MNADPRIPLRMGEACSIGPGDAVLVEGDGVVPAGVPVARFRLPGFATHAPDCACCLPRGPVAEALGRLFLARARGEVRFFSAVVALPVTAAGRRAVADALARDPLVTGRFRSAEG